MRCVLSLSLSRVLFRNREKNLTRFVVSNIELRWRTFNMYQRGWMTSNNAAGVVNYKSVIPYIGISLQCAVKRRCCTVQQNAVAVQYSKAALLHSTITETEHMCASQFNSPCKAYHSGDIQLRCPQKRILVFKLIYLVNK